MIHDGEPRAGGEEDGWPDVYGEAPPVDDRQLTQHPGDVGGES